jgi:carboxylate-amine ligase
LYVFRTASVEEEYQIIDPESRGTLVYLKDLMVQDCFGEQVKLKCTNRWWKWELISVNTVNDARNEIRFFIVELTNRLRDLSLKLPEHIPFHGINPLLLMIPRYHDIVNELQDAARSI